MRILWHSNAPWTNTGYGQQTALNVPRVAAQGHDIAISAFYGLYGAKLRWEGFDVYPGGADAWGNDVVTAHALNWFRDDPAGGAIVTLQDVWTFKTPALRYFNVASWCPVDHDPAPTIVTQYFAEMGAQPIAMSRFGEQRLQDQGLDPLYVPHSVDGDIFKPVDRQTARQVAGVPEDAFVFGMVAANKGVMPPRKAFPQVFTAFAELAKTRKDIYLYVHADHFGVSQGLDLAELAAATGVPAGQIGFVDQYALRVGIPAEAMAAVFSAFDVLVNPAYGEGFGVPIIEAGACGVPCLLNDCSSMTELKAPGSVLVEGEPWWDPKHHAFLSYPPPRRVFDAMRQMYKKQTARPDKIREWVLDRYEVGLVAEKHWRPTLQAIGKRPAATAQAVSLTDFLST